MSPRVSAIFRARARGNRKSRRAILQVQRTGNYIERKKGPFHGCLLCIARKREERVLLLRGYVDVKYISPALRSPPGFIERTSSIFNRIISLHYFVPVSGRFRCRPRVQKISDRIILHLPRLFVSPRERVDRDQYEPSYGIANRVNNSNVRALPRAQYA